MDFLSHATRPADLRSHRRESILAFAIVVIALAVYVWLISAGHFGRWPTHTHHYDLLARGFLRGQTHLIEEPSPALLALPDPYDPAANTGLRLHDASLYHGHYYLYWGPLPAILLAIVRLLPIPPDVVIGDQILVFAFMCGLLLGNAMLLPHLRRTLFPSQPWWTSGIALIAAAFAAPVVYLLHHPSIYEAAIAGGQCFLVPGIYCALRGVERNVRAGWLLSAGVCFGCAIACRFNLILPIAAIGSFIAWRVHGLAGGENFRRSATDPSGGRAIFALCAFLAPLLLTGALLITYNIARFGSPGEFGTTYQLTWLNGYKAPPADVLFSTRYFWPNLNRYCLDPIDILPRFPFLRCTVPNPAAMIRHDHLPREYFPEPVAGLATCLPFIYLALIAPLLLLWQMRREKSRGNGAETGSLTAWLTVNLLIAVLLAMAPILLVVASTMRYLADVAPLWVLLGAMGMWLAGRENSQKAGKFDFRLAGAALLALAGAVIGVLLAFPNA